MRIIKKLFLWLLPLLLLGGVLAYKTQGDFSRQSIQKVQQEIAIGLKALMEKKPNKDFLNQHSDADKPPFVRTAQIQPADNSHLSLSGIVKARNETPLAFQIGGRIISRNAEVGDHIKKEDVLFKLDSRDIQEKIKTAQANINATQANVNSARANVKTAQANVSSSRDEVNAAAARLKTALSELKRSQTLHRKHVISTQLLEKAQLAERQAREQLNAAKARVNAAIAQVNAAKARVKAALAQVSSAKAQLSQTRNTQGYTSLISPNAGILLRVSGEVGQVVGAGQRLALLALDGNREIEVAIPDFTRPPQTGVVITPQGKRIPLSLRLVSAAVDPQSRTWQVRYTIDDPHISLGLDSILRTEFSGNQAKQNLFSIPVSALDERGKGAQIWQIINERAKPKAVSVVRLTTDKAIITGDIKSGETVISLGTHLLSPGMKVRVKAK